MILKSIASIAKNSSGVKLLLFRRLQKSSTILRVPERPSLSSKCFSVQSLNELEVQVEMSLLA